MCSSQLAPTAQGRGSANGTPQTQQQERRKPRVTREQLLARHSQRLRNIPGGASPRVWGVPSSCVRPKQGQSHTGAWTSLWGWKHKVLQREAERDRTARSLRRDLVQGHARSVPALSPPRAIQANRTKQDCVTHGACSEISCPHLPGAGRRRRRQLLLIHNTPCAHTRLERSHWSHFIVTGQHRAHSPPRPKLLGQGLAEGAAAKSAPNFPAGSGIGLSTLH